MSVEQLPSPPFLGHPQTAETMLLAEVGLVPLPALLVNDCGKILATNDSFFQLWDTLKISEDTPYPTHAQIIDERPIKRRANGNNALHIPVGEWIEAARHGESPEPVSLLQKDGKHRYFNLSITPSHTTVSIRNMEVGIITFQDVTDIHKHATLDSLTQLLNRRHMEKEATRLIHRTMKKRSPVSCVILDLDHFKEVNDTHGHQTGDQAIKTCAEMLKLKTQVHTLIGRYGGEEFFFFLPELNGENLIKRADEIRQAISLGISSDTGIAVTASMGIATYPNHIDDKNLTANAVYDHLVKAADQALYEAKKTRNTLIVWNPSLPPKPVQDSK